MTLSLPPGLSPWAFHPHPEVYLEVVSLAAAYWAALRLLGPRFVEPGEPAATRGQSLSFAGGLLFIALAEGWPLAHIATHVALFGAATLMWWPVVSPLPELKRLSYPAQMVYLFIQTIIPTVPASFLTFASSPLYHFYTTVPRAFGISAVDDTRISGLIMKLGMGIVLWSIIAVLFFRWSSKEERPEQPDVLEWQAVERELNRTESNNP